MTVRNEPSPILPFTVLRRLDCVLEATKPAVLAEKEKREKAGLNPEPFLLRTAGQFFYNTSPLDLKKLMGDQDHIGENLRAYALKPGDVLMNEGGDFDKLGRGHVWGGQIDPCITQNHVFAVRPRQVSSEWLNAVTGSDFAQFYFMTRSKQSTNLASISSTNLMELPVILPPVNEQRAILSFIADQTSRLDTLTAEAQRAIDLLQERRTALISATVTGQIDVRGVCA
jgi:hypothetical protein